MQQIKRIRLGRIRKDHHRSDQSIGFQISRELFNFKHGPTRDLIAVSRFLVISFQQQRMFAFRVNEYMTVLNVACIRRRRRRLRRTRVAPYAWTIPWPANSWFDVHCNDPRIPQEYFQQLLGVNKDTKLSHLRKRLLLLILILKIGQPHPSTTARLIFGRFSRFWES